MVKEKETKKTDAENGKSEALKLSNLVMVLS